MKQPMRERAARNKIACNAFALLLGLFLTLMTTLLHATRQTASAKAEGRTFAIWCADAAMTSVKPAGSHTIVRQGNPEDSA